MFYKYHEFIYFNIFKTPVKTPFSRTIMLQCMFLYFTDFSPVPTICGMLTAVIFLYHDEKYEKYFIIYTRNF